MSEARFRRRQRLAGPAPFRDLFNKGATSRGDWLVLTVLPNGRIYSRFGCTIRRQAVPAGALRNRLKRWLRETFRLNQASIPSGLDIAAIVTRLPESASFSTVEGEFKRLIQRLGLQEDSGS